LLFRSFWWFYLLFHLLTARYALAKLGLTKPVFLPAPCPYPHLCVIKQTNQFQTNKQKQTTMKKIIAIAALVSAGFAANAQTPASSSAQQTVNMSLSDAIELTFTGSGTATGAAVTMSFANVNDYANGVTSSAQALKVRSNKNFTVAVKTNNASFTYTGSASPVPSMPVAGVLDVKVSANGTGGTIGTGFDNYKDLSSSNQSIINNGSRGGNQTFSVQYQATPGFSYPAGNYAVDVVYTATQL
jgi:hypothetical protein